MSESNVNDIDELWEELENNPSSTKEYAEKKPDRCSICGYKTKRLKPRLVGKVTFYLCKYCTSSLK